MLPRISSIEKKNQSPNHAKKYSTHQKVQDVYPEVPSSQINSKEVEKAAQFASNATGVRKDFLMGMLAVETGLGKNTGQCTYRDIEVGAQQAYNSGRLSPKAWNTFLDRREMMKEIADNLGYDYEKLQVSCNPTNYAGTGGAMGIPQFMPDTWMEYKDRVAQIVGKENPDPWDTEDGVVAMALKLSDVYGVKNHNNLAERNAAKIYLSGTTAPKYNWYANQAFYWSKNYDQLLT